MRRASASFSTLRLYLIRQAFLTPPNHVLSLFAGVAEARTCCCHPFSRPFVPVPVRKVNHRLCLVCCFQVQTVVSVQAAEAKYKSRFKPQSSRTPGTTIAFSKSLDVIFNTHGDRKSGLRTRTALSFPH